MRAALAEWPIRFAEEPAKGRPLVTFVIGHRGEERIPLLLLTLATIAAQEGIACETIVVEQSTDAILPEVLPRWVRHIHTPPPDPSMPYSRSWSLNVGIRAAAAEVVIPGDNDILVPAGYAAEAMRRLDAGLDIVDLKRFVFYLDEAATHQVARTRSLPPSLVPESVHQNLLSGGTVAVGRRAMESIGGYDESLVGWGGEDLELWERAAALRRASAGYLPFVHLWHRPQPGRAAGADAPAIRRYERLTAVPVEDRIEELRGRPWGSLSGPAGVTR